MRQSVVDKKHKPITPEQVESALSPEEIRNLIQGSKMAHSMDVNTVSQAGLSQADLPTQKPKK